MSIAFQSNWGENKQANKPGESISGRENSMCKDPEAGGCLECPRNSKESIMAENEVRELKGHWVSQLF